MTIQSDIRGNNVAAVGILAAALYDPIFVCAVLSLCRFTAALADFLLLIIWRTPKWAVILVLVPTSIVQGLGDQA